MAAAKSLTFEQKTKSDAQRMNAEDGGGEEDEVDLHFAHAPGPPFERINFPFLYLWENLKAENQIFGKLFFSAKLFYRPTLNFISTGQG